MTAPRTRRPSSRCGAWGWPPPPPPRSAEAAVAKITLRVNGRTREVDSDDPDVPLLYVLRNDLGLTGTHFGCGLAQCGACTVLVGGRAIRSCTAPVRSVVGQDVVTIEGVGSSARPVPVQGACSAEQRGRCGSL